MDGVFRNREILHANSHNRQLVKKANQDMLLEDLAPRENARQRATEAGGTLEGNALDGGEPTRPMASFENKGDPDGDARQMVG